MLKATPLTAKALACAVADARPTPLAAHAKLSSSPSHPLGRDAVRAFSYASLVAGDADAALWEWLRALNADGVTLITGAPTTVGAGERLAAQIGGAMSTLWGPSPDVPNTAKPRSQTPPPVTEDGSDGPTAMGLHVDLCAYDNTPGLQMLHCRRFDEDVYGGWSTFIDGIAAAELFREEDPEAFLALCTIPATFKLIAHDRGSEGGLPAHYTVRRPHISLDASLVEDGNNAGACAGEICGVFWSPAGEGPLAVRAADVEPYRAAREKFAALLARLHRGASGNDEDTHSGNAAGGGRGTRLITFRLREGDIAVLNNRRMMHGRRAFYTMPPTGAAVSDVSVTALTVAVAAASLGSAGDAPAADPIPYPNLGSAEAAPPRMRILQGTYVSTDEWRSRLASLHAKFGGEGDRLTRIGNGQIF